MESLGANAKKTKLLQKHCDALVNFVQNVAPWLFPADVKEPAFLNELCGQLRIITAYGWKVDQYCRENPMFEGLMHPNLQCDNAFFWTDESGKYHAGLFDWGGCGYQQYSGVFLGCLTTMIPEVYLEHEEHLFRCFAYEFKRYGGGEMDPEELILQSRLNYCLSMTGLPSNLVSYALSTTPEEEWKTIKDKTDDRVMGRWNTRCHTLSLEIQLVVWRRGKQFDTFLGFLDDFGFPYKEPWEIRDPKPRG